MPCAAENGAWLLARLDLQVHRVRGVQEQQAIAVQLDGSHPSFERGMSVRLPWRTMGFSERPWIWIDMVKKMVVPAV